MWLSSKQLEMHNQNDCRQGSKVLFAFADDVDTVTSDAKQARGIDSILNEVKTNSMVVKKNPRTRIGQNISINDYNFEVFKEFKYLRAVITTENSSEKNVEVWIIA